MIGHIPECPLPVTDDNNSDDSDGDDDDDNLMTVMVIDLIDNPLNH